MNKIDFIKLILKSPFYRKFLLIIIDLISLFLGSLVICLSNKNFDLPNSLNLIFNYKWFILITPLLGIFIYLFSGQYKSLTRFTTSKTIYQLALRNLATLFIIFLTPFTEISLFKINPIWFVQAWIILSVFSGSPRIFLRDFLLKNKKTTLSKFKKKVVIYGAGYEGVLLYNSMIIEGLYEILCFIDNDTSLWDREINGIKIHPPKYIEFNSIKIDQILLANPFKDNFEKSKILNNLQKYNIPIFSIPKIEDIASGEFSISQLKAISIEDLLSRKSVNAMPELLGKNIKDFSICVTGAGGSIGSELCRQIIKQNPTKLILLENNEYALYKINEELIDFCPKKTVLKPVLMNAINQKELENLFNNEKVDRIFHSAAYKHVPLVERNPIQGLANNILSSLAICHASVNSSVKHTILISSDKAVRPTSIMGVSKRISELIFQAFALKVENNKFKNNEKTCFSMVRFGNVLGSSGSVVPLFQKQIASGGPITLTHEKINRYFMTINEAAQLVIQAAVLAKGGDVFLLDMGKPIPIKELAKKMIRLSGLAIKDKNNINGDIEIITTGLRNGEKLFEELLIDNESSERTDHPLIFKAKENSIMPDILLPKIDQLKIAMKNQDLNYCYKIISNLVPEWDKSGIY